MRKERAQVMAEQIERLRVAAAVKQDAGVIEHIDRMVDPRVSERDMAKRSMGSSIQRRIYAPPGRTQVGLATLAHEAGHVATTPPVEIDRFTKNDRLRYEFNASRWGLEAIRRNGGKVTTRMQNDMRNALWTYVKGLPATPTPEMQAWLSGRIDL